ncbi:hypothetical protein K488DRAFT_71818 [Vararia minispora EC-137]|uniref:Uncharacterized protein n=1 Tax=Vararia minispora EC-137 TaxID=1314806 RepID=A0ACB8QH77_9AGAM|nr:hypothetical protein K488DRAFT_71818 [Vararia minispora EC-137]
MPQSFALASDSYDSLLPPVPPELAEIPSIYAYVLDEKNRDACLASDPDYIYIFLYREHTKLDVAVRGVALSLGLKYKIILDLVRLAPGADRTPCVIVGFNAPHPETKRLRRVLTLPQESDMERYEIFKEKFPGSSLAGKWTQLYMWTLRKDLIAVGLAVPHALTVTSTVLLVVYDRAQEASYIHAAKKSSHTKPYAAALGIAASLDLKYKIILSLARLAPGADRTPCVVVGYYVPHPETKKLRRVLALPQESEMGRYELFKEKVGITGQPEWYPLIRWSVALYSVPRAEF